MPIQELTRFLTELEQHRLFTSEQLQQAKILGDRTGQEVRQLAAELIRRGWLTPFQVNQLLQGRGQTLVIGPYVLLERLGQGAMGQVYKARHAIMDRLVALKVLRPELHLDHPAAADRFRREIQAAARLTHPNVVLAHDANEVGGTFFLVMEYVAGTDLARLLEQRRRLPASEAVGYARQAALGLQHAHEHGLVHRDIKPSNLIRANEGGVVKILDLGLARLHAGEEVLSGGLTHEGSIMGTPDYIAPEQASDSRSADIRADIYSLGCTLYHLLAGQPPFPGGSIPQKLLKHQQATPTAIEQLRPDVPPALAAVVRRMMARQPQDRYQTPREVAEALIPFLSTDNIPVAAVYQEPESLDTPTVDYALQPTQTDVRAAARRGWPHRTRDRLLIGAALAAGLLAILLPLLPRLTRKAAPPVEAREPDRQLAEHREKPLDPPPKKGDAEPRDTPAEKPAKPGDVEPRKVPVAEPPRPRDDKPREVPVEEPKRLAPLRADIAAGMVRLLQGHSGKIRCFAFSPDGSRLVSGGDDNVALLWDVRSGEQQGPPMKHKYPVRALAWDRDGKTMASASWQVGSEGVLKLWEPATGREARMFRCEERGTPMKAEVRSMAFSPNGRYLASGGGPLRIWDLEKGGEPTARDWQKSFPSYVYSVAFAPDGKSVAAGCHEFQTDTVRIWDVKEASDPTLVRGNDGSFGLAHTDVFGVVAFTSGGKQLVRITSNGQGGLKTSASIKVWDVDAMRQRYTLRDTIEIPGGTIFALASAADGQIRVAVTEGPPPFGGGRGFGKEPSRTAVHIWDGATQKVTDFESGHKAAITALAISPDGSRLATGSEDQSAKLWELTR